MDGIDLADFWLDHQIDQTVAQHRRREGKSDAIRFIGELYGAELAGLRHRYPPPARKLAVPPDKATRLGSARLRASPCRSSASTATCTRFDNWPSRKPYGYVPDSTPAATVPAVEASGSCGAPWKGGAWLLGVT